MFYTAFAVRERPVTRYHALHHARRDTSSAPLCVARVSDDTSSDTPSTDLDAIARLGDQIATLSAHIHAATHRLLTMIAEFDRVRGWEVDGQRSCAHWLALRTGIDLGAAREKVRAARALTKLPLTSAAMSRGELSFSQVRALTRVAEPDSERALLDLARGATTEQLERMVRAHRKNSRMDEAAAERERRASRTLAVFPDDDGMYVIRGRLTPEVGALVMRAIDAAGDALFRELGILSTTDTERDAAQRRADALGLVAERALAAGFGTASSNDGGTGPLKAGASPNVPISGARAHRYQVVLHVEPATLSADREPGRAELEDGTRVSAETCRRLACDASVVRITHDRRDAMPDVARKTRTISPALRRALEVRDRGCRFPGCGLRFTDAHHVQHWADGGGTSLSNCLLLCTHHHTLVHEGGWRVEWVGSGAPVFVDPRGQLHFDGPLQPPQLGTDPVESLLEEHRRLGVKPDACTAGARWLHDRDIPQAIYLRASEAL